MQIFYMITFILVGTVFVSWLANKLPMELPEDEFEDSKDWSKL